MTEAEWLACEDPRAMVELLRERNFHRKKVGRRKLRLLMCACCRLIWKQIVRDSFARQLVETAEAFADGRVKVEDVIELVHGENPPGVKVTRRRPDYARTVARMTCAPALNYLDSVCEYVAEAIGGDQKRAAAIPAALFRDIFGNPFLSVKFSTSWRTDTALSLARQMYESRDFGAMPILADALQDAGCEDETILNHGRDTNATHVRGCWVADLVLGKE